MRVALVTNMPAPYRVPAWNKAAEKLGEDFLVLFCCRREPGRSWTVPEITFRHQFLEENFREKSAGNYVHNNPDVWKHLHAFRPDVVITGGFNPTMLYAFLYTLSKRKKHIPLTDAWERSERHLSGAHRILRKCIYRFSHAFLACSRKGKAYFESYGLKKESVFIAHYTVGNTVPGAVPAFEARKYDLLFSGQFTERKNPMLFIQICTLVKKRRPRLKVLLLGDGPLRQQILEELRSEEIDFDYPGYATQEALPGYYADCRLFLFPTEYDAWGVVANESLTAGTPVLVTPFAGCSGELVRDGENGFVLPLDAAIWTERCCTLLEDPDLWQSMSQNAKSSAAEFTHDRSVKGLLDACTYSYRN